MGQMRKISMSNKVKGRLVFHYLLMEIWLGTLILFGTEHILQELLSKIKDRSITRNIFRIQDDDSVMCGFYNVNICLQEKLC